MMFKVVIFLFLLTSNVLVASNAIKIEGSTLNVVEGSLVQLIQYKDSDVELARTKVNKSRFDFNLGDSIADGIYSLILTNNSNDSPLKIYKYDVILDKSEGLIKLKIDPNNEITLVILISKINANYYDFLKVENFRHATINYATLAINSEKKSALNPRIGYKEIVEREIKELKEIRSNYIDSNFNKWSTELVRNSTSILLYENVNRGNYWSFFSTKNSDLINSPIFHNLIQEYLIRYYNSSLEEDYKAAFEEVISQFSYSELGKEWIVEYIITGLNQLGNKNLIDFFSKKYNYKI